jgi:hypothetical protein
MQKWLARLDYIGQEYPFGPNEIKRNEDGQVHCATGPAIISPTRCVWYEDGRKHGLDVDIYGTMACYFRNVLIPHKYFFKPEELTVEEVVSHPNAEVRAVGLHIYGVERLEEEGHFQVVNEDEKGTLLKYENPKLDEPMVLAKVVNSTPEPDGTHKIYYLRVPPDMTSCRQAVAWTFGMDENEYNPIHET